MADDEMADDGTMQVVTTITGADAAEIEALAHKVARTFAGSTHRIASIRWGQGEAEEVDNRSAARARQIPRRAEDITVRFRVPVTITLSAVPTAGDR